MITHLDFRGSKIGDKEKDVLAHLLLQNRVIKQINLDEDFINQAYSELTSGLLYGLLAGASSGAIVGVVLIGVMDRFKQEPISKYLILLGLTTVFGTAYLLQGAFALGIILGIEVVGTAIGLIGVGEVEGILVGGLAGVCGVLGSEIKRLSVYLFCWLAEKYEPHPYLVLLSKNQQLQEGSEQSEHLDIEPDILEVISGLEYSKKIFIVDFRQYPIGVKGITSLKEIFEKSNVIKKVYVKDSIDFAESWRDQTNMELIILSSIAIANGLLVGHYGVIWDYGKIGPISASIAGTLSGAAGMTLVETLTSTTEEIEFTDVIIGGIIGGFASTIIRSIKSQGSIEFTANLFVVGGALMGLGVMFFAARATLALYNKHKYNQAAREIKELNEKRSQEIIGEKHLYEIEGSDLTSLCKLLQDTSESESIFSKIVNLNKASSYSHLIYNLETKYGKKFGEKVFEFIYKPILTKEISDIYTYECSAEICSFKEIVSINNSGYKTCRFEEKYHDNEMEFSNFCCINEEDQTIDLISISGDVVTLVGNI